MLRIYSKNPHLADQVAVNYRKADITDKQRAMLDYACKVSQKAETVSEEDFAALKAHGYSTADIWTIGSIASWAMASSRNAASIRLRRIAI